jgi:nudix-type nucleoside diphosphatase (YffH/AdpP family)
VVHREPVTDPRYPLRRYTVDRPGPGGVGQRLIREACHRGDSAAVLLCHSRRGTVVLTRQFRLPPLLNGHPDGQIIEVPGGLLDQQPPAEAARREVLEETGYRPAALRRVLVAYLTPCLVTERVHLFVAGYEDYERVSTGGGVAAEGEDIEVMELPARQVWQLAERGEIVDGKTLLLLYYAAAYGILPLPDAAAPKVATGSAA